MEISYLQNNLEDFKMSNPVIRIQLISKKLIRKYKEYISETGQGFSRAKKSS